MRAQKLLCTLYLNEICQVNIQWWQVKLHCGLTKFRLLWNNYFHPYMSAMWMWKHKRVPIPCACTVHCHAWAIFCNTMVCTKYPYCNSFLCPCPSKYLNEGGQHLGMIEYSIQRMCWTHSSFRRARFTFRASANWWAPESEMLLRLRLQYVEEMQDDLRYCLTKIWY